MNKDVLNIDGVEYVTKDSKAECLDGMEYKIIRTRSAGVFAGYIESRDGLQTVIRQARRLWRWYGAASLSQLAEEGTSDPENCKFPIAVDKITVTETIEILDVTKQAQESIEGVPVWSA